MKLDFKSIKFKMWAYFILFAALILLVLWFLQIIFLNNYYKDMKMREIEKAANTIISQYGQHDFGNVILRHAFRNNMLVMVTDMDGNVVSASDSFGDRFDGHQGDSQDGPRGGGPHITNFQKLRQEVLNSRDGKAHFTVDNSNFKGTILIYGALLKDSAGGQYILYISSPLEPIDSTVAILKNQLVYVTIIILFLAFVISFLISRKLSKPIARITDSARELAGGNYSVMFEKGDYTEIGQLSSTLNYATRELMKLDEYRKDLIANVSHDLRTPLTMVKAYAEMIRDISGENREKRDTHLKVIIDEADRLNMLVNDMLDLSKIESGNMVLKMDEFDISKTVRTILQRFNVLSERSGYTFTLNCEDTIMVTADKLRIEQVIYNLISNAVNYTGDDKHVNINLHANDGSARFEVTDTGKGIPREELESIWERYYKAKETHKRAVIGTGLGLSIVKNILRLHNADFGVISSVGKGSTFWFELKTGD